MPTSTTSFSGLSAGELAAALPSAEPNLGAALLDNYVTAMIELACHRRGIQPPVWTANVPPLERPHFATSLGRLRPHLLRAAPVPFKRRNIFVDATLGDRT